MTLTTRTTQAIPGRFMQSNVHSFVRFLRKIIHANVAQALYNKPGVDKFSSKDQLIK